MPRLSAAGAVSADQIRALFAQALSQMYQAEAPRYRALTELVATVNALALAGDPALVRTLEEKGEVEGLAAVRHGAIRLGTARELFALRRLFAVLGMAPVGYYDLSGAGLPVHSTAFRPIGAKALRANPFRMFVSLLRLELVDDDALRREAAATLARRDIFSPRLIELLELFEESDGFNETIAREFVAEAVETFRFRREAAIPEETYRRLFAAHPLLADIAGFASAHVNHLTLRALDIDAAQRALVTQDMRPKAIVEGPPRRRCPILLRQTSYRAVPEPIRFARANGAPASGAHAARFGEIEQRGAALTGKGRRLYDRLLGETMAAAPPAGDGSNAPSFEQELRRRFAAFPDDHETLRREGLAFYRFSPGAEARDCSSALSAAPTPEDLVQAGVLRAEPILYEDFLPSSAAGIFRSNLGEASCDGPGGRADRAAFEEALGARVADDLALYEEEEARSLAASLEALGFNRDLFIMRAKAG